MDDDENDFFFTPDGALDDFFDDTPRSRRFRRSDLFVLGLDLAHGLIRAVTETALEARNRAAMHANWEFDQTAFHEEAAREIEAIISGDESE